MSQQTLPVIPAGRVTSVTSIAAGFAQRQEWTSVLYQVLNDMVALRNAVDNLNTLFLAHTHKIPAGALAAQSSGPDNTTAAGGAATAPTANAAPANVGTGV